MWIIRQKDHQYANQAGQKPLERAANRARQKRKNLSEYSRGVPKNFYTFNHDLSVIFSVVTIKSQKHCRSGLDDFRVL